MDKNEIIREFVENFKLCRQERIDEIIGYPEVYEDIPTISACAAAMTIITCLKEDK